MRKKAFREGARELQCSVQRQLKFKIEEGCAQKKIGKQTSEKHEGFVVRD